MQYEIVRENLYDERPRTQVDQWIAVSGDLTPQNLRAFLSARYDSVMMSGEYAANQQPTNVYIYLFDSKDAAERGGFGWLAMLEKRPEQEVSIRIDEERIESIRH